MRLMVAGVGIALDRSSLDVLSHLLRHAGEVVPKDDLLRAGWPGRVVSENSLAKAIGRLRQALNDSEGELLRVVHGYGYKLVADVERLPPAQVAAPHQVDATIASAVPIDGRAPSPAMTAAQPSRRHGLLLLVSLLLTLASIVVLRPERMMSVFLATDPVPVASNSIAVLPFVDLSSAQDQGYFSDGLAEQLIDSLARLPQLRVASRTSSFAYRNRRDDIQAIGRALNVATVLEGSVRRSGDRIRVTAQLIDSANGYHRWSQTYDRPLGELFEMQDELARAIVGALSVQLQPGQEVDLGRHGTRNPEAYEQFLLGARLFRDDETAHRRAIAAYERAVALDPNYLDAWFRLADALGFSGMYADSAEEALAGKRRAREIAEQIIAIAPQRADAYYLRGAHAYSHWYDWQDGEADLERAAALSSRDDLRYLLNLARLRAATGGMDDALALTQRAVEIDPMQSAAFAVQGYHLLSLRRFDEARAALQQGISVQPLDEHAHYYLGLIELLSGNARAALPHFDDSAHFLRVTGRAAAFHTLGDAVASERELKLLIERYGHILPYQAAEVHAWRGEPDQAFAWMQRAVELHDASIMYLRFDPLIDSLRSDARFAALLTQVGLTEPPTLIAPGDAKGPR